MTAEAFNYYKNTYGDKICFLWIDNDTKIGIRYGTPGDVKHGWITMDDVTVVNHGGADFLEIRRKVTSQGSEPINMLTVYPLDVIQGIFIADCEPREFKWKNPDTGEIETRTGYVRLDPLMN